MFKTRPIDRYIKQATAGLPRLERIDTAAELRVNLNLRIKELMLEGHTPEEAELLVVKNMGDAASTNRAFIFNRFKLSIGWLLVSASIFGGAGFWLFKTSNDARSENLNSLIAASNINGEITKETLENLNNELYFVKVDDGLGNDFAINVTDKSYFGRKIYLLSEQSKIQPILVYPR